MFGIFLSFGCFLSVVVRTYSSRILSMFEGNQSILHYYMKITSHKGLPGESNYKWVQLVAPLQNTTRLVFTCACMSCCLKHEITLNILTHFFFQIIKVLLQKSREEVDCWIYLLFKYKPHMMELPFLKAYSSSGNHGKSYCARYLRQGPEEEYWTDVKFVEPTFDCIS